jgi:hypothetical protein
MPEHPLLERFDGEPNRKIDRGEIATQQLLYPFAVVGLMSGFQPDKDMDGCL